MKNNILLFVYLVLLFSVHRLSVFSELLSAIPDYTFMEASQYYRIGLMSDIWISFLLAALCLLIESILKIFRIRVSVTHAFAFLSAVFTFLHMGYVQFFRQPVVPAHLRYLYNTDYIAANWTSCFEWQNAIFVALALISWPLCLRFGAKISILQRPRNAALILVTSGILALLMHVLNIPHRTGKMIPPQVTMNFMEGLFAKYEQNPMPLPLNAQELTLLSDRLGISLPASASYEEKIRLLFSGAGKGLKLHPGFSTVKNAVATHREAQRPLYVFLLLFESLRQIDIGFSETSQISLTPELDHLLSRGVAFTNAWSTGTVTRGAQESLFCGHIGNIHTSLMSEFPTFPAQCLTQNIPSYFFWHGGMATFDRQVDFYKRHGVQNFLTYSDFPSGSPNCGWGISDLALFNKTNEKIRQLASQEGLHMGTVLTVTNHIPWDLPEDAPVDIRNHPQGSGHPSEKTVRYTDYALGKWIDELKDLGIWQDSLVILVGDHGIAAESLRKEPHPRSVELGNVVLALSGGLIETLHGLVPQVMKKPVSQAGIFTFLCDLLDFKLPSHADNIWAEESVKPIVSDQGESVYFPALGMLLETQQVFRQPSEEIKDDRLRYAVLYYRGFMEFMHSHSIPSA